jgi:hypothetical protein
LKKGIIKDIEHHPGKTFSLARQPLAEKKPHYAICSSVQPILVRAGNALVVDLQTWEVQPMPTDTEVLIFPEA